MIEAPTKPQPFAGVTVIEFGQFVAVPFCAQLLSDGGAHVIKVEPLDGDPIRQLGQVAPKETRYFLLRNRGKHSLPIDLHHPRAQTIIDALLTRADVVLTNMRPGLAGEVGLDGPTLLKRYPRLIVGNVSAFGDRGPDAGLAGMDVVVQARSGLMAAMGKVKDGLPDGGPSPIADYMCSALLAFGISSALLRRERTGRGGEVDVALLMAAMVLQNNLMIRVDSVDAEEQGQRLARLAAGRAAGASFVEQAEQMPSLRQPAMDLIYYRTFATKDAALAIACPSAALRRRLINALALDDPAIDAPIHDRAAQTAHYTALRDRIEALMRTRTTAEWTAVLNDAGVPASGVRFALELMDDPQMVENGFFADMAHPTLGNVRVLSSPLALDGRDNGFRPSHVTAPFASETRAILSEAGFDEAAIDDLIASGATHDHVGEGGGNA